jgi:hypothetical protein
MPYLTKIDMAHRSRSSPSPRLVQVFAAASIPEGLLARSLLESEGIPVFTKGESEGPYRMGPVYLFVPEDVEVQAGVILAEALSSSSAGASEDAPEDVADDYRLEY